MIIITVTVRFRTRITFSVVCLKIRKNRIIISFIITIMVYVITAVLLNILGSIRVKVEFSFSLSFTVRIKVIV